MVTTSTNANALQEQGESVQQININIILLWNSSGVKHHDLCAKNRVLITTDTVRGSK